MRSAIRDYAARGFAVGLASHGIGTARAFAVDPVAGVFAGIAMGLNAVVTPAILIPALLPWLTRANAATQRLRHAGLAHALDHPLALGEIDRIVAFGARRGSAARVKFGAIASPAFTSASASPCRPRWASAAAW